MAKKLNFLIQILFIFGIHFSHAQNKNIGIEAILIDQKSKSPLPFANIHVEGTYTGTISNEEGKFELLVKQKYAKNNIVFSFMGYDNTVKKVKNLKIGDTIYMKLSATSLNEVKISGKNKYRELVKEAIKKIPENYSQKPTYLNAYYRELTQIDKHYTKFTDAATKIFYSSYNDKYDQNLSYNQYFKFNRTAEFAKMPFPEPKELIADSRDAVSIVAFRRSDNLQDYKMLENTKKLKNIEKNHLKWLENNEIGGGPLRLTGADKVKRKQDFLSLELNEAYKFTLHKKSSYNNLPVYIIAFKPKDSLSIKARYYGKITIDKQSKAIINYSYKPTKLIQNQLNQKFAAQLKTPKAVEETINKKFISRVTELNDFEVNVSFEKLDSTWFLKRINTKNTYINYGDYLDDYTAVTESELVVNNVETDNAVVFHKAEMFQSTFMNPLFNFGLTYNPQFWKSYSSLIATGIVDRALKDLESKNSLEEQFNR